MKRSLLIAMVMLLAAPAAHAGPLGVEQDRSDNTFSFTYNGASGEIERASSSRILRRRDRVAFLLYVRERKEAEIGERLVGRMELDLLVEKALRYRGNFTFEVSDPLGNVIYQGSQYANVLLRPQDRQREEVLRIPFDLPSGEYSAVAFFEAD